MLAIALSLPPYLSVASGLATPAPKSGRGSRIIVAGPNRDNVTGAAANLGIISVRLALAGPH